MVKLSLVQDLGHQRRRNWDYCFHYCFLVCFSGQEVLRWIEAEVDWLTLPWGLEKRRCWYALAQLLTVRENSESKNKGPTYEEVKNDCPVKIKTYGMGKGLDKLSREGRGPTLPCPTPPPIQNVLHHYLYFLLLTCWWFNHFPLGLLMNIYQSKTSSQWARGFLPCISLTQREL